MIVEADAAVAHIHPVDEDIVSRHFYQAAFLRVCGGADGLAACSPKSFTGGAEMLGIDVFVGSVAVASVVPDHVAASGSIRSHTRAKLGKRSGGKGNSVYIPKQLPGCIYLLGKEVWILSIQAFIFPDDDGSVVAGSHDAGFS